MFSREIPEEAIIRLFKEGNSKRKIRDMIKVGADRINNAIDFYEKTGRIPQPAKMGRPTKATDEVLSTITLCTVNDRSISASNISDHFSKNMQISLSPTSINRYRKQLNFNYLPPKIRQDLSDIQIEKRKIFPHSIYSHSIISKEIDLSRLMFSD